MKVVKKDPTEELKEQLEREEREKQRKERQEILKDFRLSKPGILVREILEEEITKSKQVIEEIIKADLQQVFVKDYDEKQKKIDEMSKKYIILQGVLDTLQRVKNRIY